MIEQAEQTELKLIRCERQEGDPIPLERRDAHRKPASGRVTTLITIKEQDESVRNRICSLDLRDISDTGIGAVTEDALPRDANVTVFFPPHGPERGFDLYGTIAWCRPGTEGFEVGVRLNRQAAACA